MSGDGSDAGGAADEDGDGDDRDDGADRGYRHVAVDDVANTPNPTRAKRELDEAVGASLFGCNYYEADPGERVPWGFHRHPDHEELFYVIDGELAVETPGRTYRVGADEAFFVPAGAPNRAVAAGDEPCRFLAVGAPKDADGAVISEECPACGAEADREYDVEPRGEGADPDAEEYVLRCAACGAETDRFSG
ncbi:cupin domain-containing protein [Halobaculum gomorrense]|uniref:Cupin domain protein n=1 Tax=Halobaculum gomorrense TaxID=43928 RepID=A0A1M5TRK9_9EURY|nr:cupin domain-containing protein [Halobaculum gomorrense]SHH53455.1 Cupin domain protein [Halobaculum gomorrense]